MRAHISDDDRDPVGELELVTFLNGHGVSQLTQKDLDLITEFLNNKYRKSLGYHSPNECRAMLEGIKSDRTSG